MNKTLLLIICDFLLLNLIHFTAWDNLDQDSNVPAAGGAETLGSGMGDPSQDLELVKLMLDQSEQEQAATEQKLDETQETLGETEETLGSVEEKLGNKEQALGNAEKMNLAILSEYEQFKEFATKEAKENTEQNQKLVDKIAELNTNIDGLKFNLNTTTTNLTSARNTVKNLDKQLAAAEALAKERGVIAQAAKKEAGEARIEANAAKEVAAKANAQIAKANAETVAAKERVQSAEDRAQTAQNKVVNIERALATAKTQSQELAKAVANEQQDKQVAQEAARQLREEVIKKIPDQPINANMMATLYDQNHIDLITTTRTFGSPNLSTKTVLIEVMEYDERGRKKAPYVHAITHTKDTHFKVAGNVFGKKETYGTLSKNSSKPQNLHHVRFLESDPRIIIAPIGPLDSPQVQGLVKLGIKPYKLAAKPFKFPKAFLIKKDGRKFGEVIFQMDPKNRDYVKLEKGFIRALMGEFQPSQGDLVFSQTGELLGMMANSKYCHIIRHVDPAAAIRFGKISPDEATKTLRDMHRVIASKSSELR
jgi:chemotaxis protein histidine kinase CheA